MKTNEFQKIGDLAGGFIAIDHERSFQYKKDGLNVTRTIAWSGPGCHEGCGVLLFTDANGKLVKVEGDPEHPFNHGRLCVRCLDLPEVVYSSKRLLYPMRRQIEDRGKDTWERITWDEAIDCVVERLIKIRESYGAETVLFIDGTARDSMAWLTRLAWSFGSPNYNFHMSGEACLGPRVGGCNATAGSFFIGDYALQFPDRYDNPAYEIPEYIVLWGNNPIVSNSDGFFGHWVVDLMKRGTKLITIDPRRIWLAARSEEYLPVRPGTDCALALGMLHVMIEEGIYDREFVEKWCYGFDELAKRVEEWTPERTAEATWVPAEKIVRTARKLASAKNFIIQWGVPVDMTKNALPTNQAIQALWQITGNIDKPGAMIEPVTIVFYLDGWGKEFLPQGQDQKRLGYDDFTIFRSGVDIAQTDVIIRTLETEKPYKLRAAYLQTTNFLSCAGADPKRTLEAYKTLEFICAVDIFMTPTIMALADVVLPAATYPERNGIHIPEGLQRAEVMTKVCDVGETKSDMQINLEIGKRLNAEAWPWHDDIEMFDSYMQETGLSFKELQEASPVFLPFEYHRHEKGKLRADGTAGFNTPTGRIELWSNFYNRLGYDPLPAHRDPETEDYTEAYLKQYPLILNPGARQWASFHSEHRQIPRLRNMHPDATAYISQNTAHEYGVIDGEWIWIENELGRCKRRVEIVNNLNNDRIIQTDHGWWLPEESGEADAGLFGLWDVACNQLKPYDPSFTGLGSNYRSIPCKISKMEAGE
jgi:anaerobic selenocysteine-containing dehydrogenase